MLVIKNRNLLIANLGRYYSLYNVWLVVCRSISKSDQTQEKNWFDNLDNIRTDFKTVLTHCLTHKVLQIKQTSM